MIGIKYLVAIIVLFFIFGLNAKFVGSYQYFPTQALGSESSEC